MRTHEDEAGQWIIDALCFLASLSTCDARNALVHRLEMEAERDSSSC